LGFYSVIIVSRSSRVLVLFVSSYNLLEVVPCFCKYISHSAVGYLRTQNWASCSV